ncbi:11797_t:CDS:2 [Ambispora gerdemannii]|uniref:11797_t:CDS:1 n=1 Tax=Ambispora gerdemannii TaxID=144530 RepID=A0A9N9C6E6_9GLOM|nr:11797_t:CDS:2 [Ambispora gerdemannii]
MPKLSAYAKGLKLELELVERLEGIACEHTGGPGDGEVDARCETAMLKYAFQCNNDPPSSVSEEQSGALGIIVSAPGNKFTQCAIESARAFVYPILRTDIARLPLYILNITFNRLQGRPFEFFYLS